MEKRRLSYLFNSLRDHHFSNVVLEVERKLVNKTLRATPAMAANVTKRLWEIGDILDVLEVFENQRAAA